ncbi:MAG: nitroreductase family protein [Pirellulales bacterium]
MTQSNPKFAVSESRLLPAIAERWSPYLFDGRPVERTSVAACLEAARWAASSYNEQPWFFLLAHREDEAEFAKIVDCLLDANQAWAKAAGVLMLTVVSRTFRRNGTPNRMAEHDLGLAVGNLSLQATSLGLAVHQMAGIVPSRIRQSFGIPEGFDPVTALALGYAADPASADGPLAERDRAARNRKPLGEFVYQGNWNRPAF